MASHSLVLGLPRVFSSLPPSLAPPCTSCVASRLRATPHSSSLRPATAPFQTLRMDVWGPAPTLEPERECYLLVVVDDYSKYTMVFPLAKKSEVTSTLIRWLLAAEGTRGSHVRCLHSDYGGEFRSGILAGFCGEQGIRESWTMPKSPQQNGVAERGIGLLSARAIPCVFLGFLVGSPDYSFYHPPLHQFLDSRDARFDESVSYYTRYPCQGLPVPPPPFFLAPSPPPAPAPPVPPPPPGPASSGTATGGTRSGGARSRGAGGASAGGASSGGAGAGGSGTGGASSRGAGAGCTGTGGASFGGAGAGGAGAGVGGVGEAGAATVGPAATAAAADAAAATFAAAVPSSEWPSGHWSSFLSSFSLPVTYCIQSYWTNRCPLRARPSSPLVDLCTVLFRSPPRRSLPVSVLPSPHESSLTVSSHPVTDYNRAARPVVSHVLASLFTDPRASPSSVLALTAAVADFASTCRLHYATRVVASPPPRPLSVGGESALGCDVQEDRQFELEFLAAASPSLCTMLLSLEGDPDALDKPTPHTYREAVSGEWASQWKAAMDAELAPWRSTGMYVNAVPPPSANIVDGMWLFKVKRPPGSPPVFKARYVVRGFSQCEGVEFFQTFAPTPKMTTLRVLLHVAAQRDYELHSLDFSTAFLQGRLDEEI
ncbi:unnamed protein product [Closterium sp. NIES-53]